MTIVTLPKGYSLPGEKPAPKKKHRFSASGYSTNWLKKNGYTVANVEKDQRYPKAKGELSKCQACGGQVDSQGHSVAWESFKRDLWGFADLIAMKRNELGVTLIQTTTSDHYSDRLTKIAGIVEARTVLASGNRIHIHSWKLTGGKGKPKAWILTVYNVWFDEDGIIQSKAGGGEMVQDKNEPQAMMDFEAV